MDDVGRARVASAWDKLQEEWRSDEAHRRFIALCSAHDALGEAGRRYRSVRDSDPELRDDVERHLRAVMAAALDQLMSARTPRRSVQKRAMWLMVGVCGFFVVYAILALLRVRSH